LVAIQPKTMANSRPENPPTSGISSIGSHSRPAPTALIA